MSFLYLLNKLSTQLSLVNNNGYQFNEKMEVVSSKSKSEINKFKVLNKIENMLLTAKVYHLSNDCVNRFLENLLDYSFKPETNDRIKKKYKIIFDAIVKKTNNVWSCFRGEHAKKINIILDKKELSEDDYYLLLDLSNRIASRYWIAQSMCKKIAIFEKIKDLRKECPDLGIDYLSDLDWRPSYRYSIPDDNLDLCFLIFVEKYYAIHGSLTYKDENFLKEIVQRKFSSTDLGFKKNLHTHLIIHVLADFTDQWDDLEDEILLACCFSLKHKASVNEYSKEFIREPLEYIKLQTSKFHPFFETNVELEKIAQELIVGINKTKYEMNEWYEAMYQKMRVHTQDQAELPILTPEEFKSLNFISKNDLHSPLLKKINQWEKEVQEKENEKQKIVIPPLKRQAVRTSKAYQSTQTETDHLLLQTEIPSLGDLTSKVFSEENQSVIPGNEITKSEKKSVKKGKKKSLTKLLKKSSPFQVHDRILAWFDPGKTHESMNHESQFIHNFAWCLNTLVFQFGLSYARKNKKGDYQPALTLLCQVEHAFFTEPELFRVTMTFDQILEGAHCPFKCDPLWTCYHRALTRRSQKEKIVEEYIKIAKHQFIDFPPLPSQSRQITTSEFLNEKFPDGSYIESVNGHVITIRDPKHDSKNVECKIHLFIVE